MGPPAQEGRIVVVGSSNWISNYILGAPIANRDLLLNMMNWLTSDEDLISIRPKEPEDRRLRVTGAGLRMIFLSSVIFLPLIVIFSGVSVWWKRRCRPTRPYAERAGTVRSAGDLSPVTYS